MVSLRVGAGLIVSLVVAFSLGCASGPAKPTPTPLEAVAPTIAVRPAWKGRIEAIGFALAVAVNGSTFTVAGSDGTVLALNAESGRELWRKNVGTKLSAGVGSDGRFAAVVTRNNELVTLEMGKEKWRRPLVSRVITAPLVAGERVFVVGLDRAVHAFDAFDGAKLWTFQRPGDALTLSQASVLASFKDTLLVGQGATLVGLDPLRGMPRWEATVASPRGANEVERLADLVGPPARMGDTVCVRAFQAAVGCVNAERGSVAWTRHAAGILGVSAGENMVVGADASDRITAWRASDGSVAWNHTKLLYRGLSAPLNMGASVVLGDSQGMVHWLSRDTGVAQLILPTDGSPIAVTPVKSGPMALVVTRNGGMFAFRSE